MVFQEAELDDHGVILEYQLPLSSRRVPATRAVKYLMDMKSFGIRVRIDRPWGK
jgi:hypothetical protein